jgi:hypothetical protein
MATGSTLSAFSSQDSSIQSMLLSVVPPGLQQLALCRGRLPYNCLTIDELDAIVEGKDTGDLESSIADGIYLTHVLPAIDWWIDVALDVAGGNGMEYEFCIPAYDVQKRNLLTLLNDALSSYSAALAEVAFHCNSERIPAGMELLRRYRMLTQYVCSFAQEVWPNVDMGWLLKQA